MRNKNADYQFGNTTVRKAALYAMKQVDFHFTDDITRADFITDRQFASFMDRANDLEIKIIKDADNKEEQPPAISM